MALTNTPFNYTGSKFKLLTQIIPLFDTHKLRFVDLFTGGGSVYTNIVHLYAEVLVNDIISDLVNIQKNLIFDKENTVDKVKSLVVGKEDQLGYNLLREDYNLNPSPEKLYALMLCCTNNMMRFNQKFKFNQTFGKRTFNPNTEQKINDFVDHVYSYRNNITFKTETFYNIEPTSNSMNYLDPPYTNSLAGYNAYWQTHDDIGLFDYCKNLNSIGASFAVSGVETHDGKSCRLIDLLIAEGFKKHLLVADYNKVSRKGNKETQEVLITNY